MAEFAESYSSLLKHDLSHKPIPSNGSILSKSNKTTTVYIQIPQDVDVEYKPIDEVPNLDDLMRLTHNVGAILSLDCHDQFSDSVVFSSNEAECALMPLVKSSKKYLKTKGFTDDEISIMLAEYNLDETAIIPLVLACAETEKAISSSTTKCFRDHNNQTKDMTWSGVGDCALQAIGIDIFFGLSQSTLKTWSKAAIKRAFKAIVPIILGPIGVAIIVAEFIYCLYNL